MLFSSSMGKERLKTAVKLFLLALAMAAVAALIFFVLRQSRPLEYKMADGSILRVEKVSFGKLEEFKPGGRMRIARDWVMEQLAKLWPRRFTAPSANTSSSWWFNTPVHTNNDALHVWVTRRDAATGKYLDVGFVTAQLKDEHGCTFTSTQAGGQDDGLLARTASAGGSSVVWFRFEAFPRHEKTFRLKVSNYSSTKNDPDLAIPNPAPPPRQADWTAEPLPITKRDREMAFTLTGINMEKGQNNSRFQGKITPTFDVMERGQLTKEWQPVNMELYDGSGNFSSTLYLCPWEPVWKLVVRFFGSEQSAVASNFVWTISGVKVPREGEFVTLNATNQIEGVAMKVISLAGAGNVTYSNGVVVHASPIEDGQRANTRSSSVYGNNKYKIDLGSITPHVALEISPLPENQRLTLRVTDDRGRQFYAREEYAQITSQKEIHYLSGLSIGQPNFLMLDLPKDAKTVDLTFCIHNARTEVFIFKPPTPTASGDKKTH